MASISKQIADKLISNGGYYDLDDKGSLDNMRCVKIITYNNIFDNGLTYACIMEYEYFNRYEESPCTKNVKTIWLAQNP